MRLSGTERRFTLGFIHLTKCRRIFFERFNCFPEGPEGKCSRGASTRYSGEGRLPDSCLEGLHYNYMRKRARGRLGESSPMKDRLPCKLPPHALACSALGVEVVSQEAAGASRVRCGQRRCPHRGRTAPVPPAALTGSCFHEGPIKSLAGACRSGSACQRAYPLGCSIARASESHSVGPVLRGMFAKTLSRPALKHC